MSELKDFKLETITVKVNGEKEQAIKAIPSNPQVRAEEDINSMVLLSNGKGLLIDLDGDRYVKTRSEMRTILLHMTDKDSYRALMKEANKVNPTETTLNNKIVEANKLLGSNLRLNIELVEGMSLSSSLGEKIEDSKNNIASLIESEKVRNDLTQKTSNEDFPELSNVEKQEDKKVSRKNNGKGLKR